MHDLLIIGGGPAGAAAGVYAGRKKLNTVLVTDQLAGKSVVSGKIENWVGIKSISGLDLAKNLEGHVRAYDIEIIEGDLVERVRKMAGGFKVSTKNGKEFEAKTVLIASGSRHKKLGVPGEDKFDGRGVAYCATCDAPLFKDKAVAVIGAGNVGLETVRDLLPYVKKISLLVRSEVIKGEAMTSEEISKSPKVEIIYNTEVREILGKDFVAGLKYLDKKSGSLKELKLGGVFVEIGAVPNSEFVKDLVNLDKWGQVMVNCKTQASSLKGIWAAGDVSDTLYRQNNIAAGDAIKAVLNINDYLNKNNK